MTGEIERYWYVAAVFRDPHALARTIGALRAKDTQSGQIVVIANHCSEDARKALDRDGEPLVPVLAAGADGCMEAGAAYEAHSSIEAILQAIGLKALPETKAVVLGAQESPFYAQLRRDVADGALVLVASVADPEAQLRGARIMLRGNCDCVLTHEIAAKPDEP